MKSFNIIPLLILFISSCSDNNDEIISTPSGEGNHLDKLSDQTQPESYNIDSLVFTRYQNTNFIDDLNNIFNKSKSHKLKETTIDSVTVIEEYSDDKYYYLIIKNNEERKVIYGSETLNCKALFGELSNVFENSFIWKYSNGCGSAQKETWIEFDYDGGFKYSSNEYLWSDSLCSTMFFKLRNINDEIFAYNIEKDSFWNVYHLNNEITFYDSYNWTFDLIDNKEVRGVYHHNNNDTIFISL